MVDYFITCCQSIDYIINYTFNLLYMLSSTVKIEAFFFILDVLLLGW